MKLVEPEIPHGDEEVLEIPRPPRPERRRVYVSLALTLGVLAATVAAVYLAFPKRDNELLTEALEAHRASPDDVEVRERLGPGAGEPGTGGEAHLLELGRRRVEERPRQGVERRRRAEERGGVQARGG